MLFKKSLALIYYLLNSDENEKFSFKVKDANKGKSKEDFVPQWENITKEIIEKKKLLGEFISLMIVSKHHVMG